jgi:CRP/FNR family transcriptional regulator
MIEFKKSSNCNNCNDCNRRSPLFSTLNPEELAQINEDRFEATYRKGEMIFKQGSASSHILMLTSGLAKIYLESGNNRGLIIKLLKPIQMFGGPGLFLDGRNYYSATALVDSTVCFITQQKFRQAVRTNPDFAEKFIEYINKNAIYNFGKLTDLTQKQMPGLVADAFIYLSTEIYNSTQFKLTLSRQDLADMTNLSKESVIRILKEFKDEGILVSKGDHVEITDLEHLKQISAVG